VIYGLRFTVYDCGPSALGNISDCGPDSYRERVAESGFQIAACGLGDLPISRIEAYF